MKIVLNGEAIQIIDHCSITKILEILGLENQKIAVEVNREVIPRTEHMSFILSSNDQVEIIQAVGGG